MVMNMLNAEECHVRAVCTHVHTQALVNKLRLQHSTIACFAHHHDSLRLQVVRLLIRDGIMDLIVSCKC